MLSCCCVAGCVCNYSKVSPAVSVFNFEHASKKNKLVLRSTTLEFVDLKTDKICENGCIDKVEKCLNSRDFLLNNYLNTRNEKHCKKNKFKIVRK